MEVTQVMGTSDILKSIADGDWMYDIMRLFMHTEYANPEYVKEVLEKYGIDYREFHETTDRVRFCVGDMGVKIALTSRGIGENVKEWYLSRSGSLDPFIIKVFDTNGIIQITESYDILDKI